MTDANDKAEASDEATEDVGPVAGERLAIARREQQIPVIEIAKELHLDEPKVRALERNEFDVLGAPVFAKGHLRKYAQLVDVSADDVMADYYQLNREASTPLVVSARKKPRREMSPGPWIAAIVLLLAAAAAYWWFVERQPVLPVSEAGQTTHTDNRGSVELPVPLADEQGQDPVVQERVDDQPAHDEVVNEVAVDVTEPEAVLETLVDTMQLSIFYSGECWTEITDAGGRRLFFDLGRAGRTVNLSGEAPFNVLFGNADNVALEVNGTAFNIPAVNRRGKTARFTITGS